MFSRSKNNGVLVVKMEDLAILWMQDPIPPPILSNDHSGMLSMPDGILFCDQISQFRSDFRETNLFWSHYILRHIKTIMAVPGLIEAIISILKELDQSDVSSIDPTDNEIPEQYHALKNTSLREHSIAVARRMVEIIESKQEDLNPLIGKAMVAGLAHDIGILHKAYNNANHSQNSAVWIENLLKEQKNRGIITDAIKFHHIPDKNLRIDNPVLRLLRLANSQVRDEELKVVKRGIPESPDTLKPEKIITPPPPDLGEALASPKNPDRRDEPVSPQSPETLAAALKKRITPEGFDAFVFEGKAYIRPIVIKEALSELTGVDPAAIVIESYLSPGMGITSGKYKLRFKKIKGDRLPPQSFFYFVLDVTQLGELDEIQTYVPRDLEGRWLHKILPEDEALADEPAGGRIIEGANQS